jgi:hypothetical protein
LKEPKKAKEAQVAQEAQVAKKAQEARFQLEAEKIFQVTKDTIQVEMEWEWPKVRALQVKRLFHHYP